MKTKLSSGLTITHFDDGANGETTVQIAKVIAAKGRGVLVERDGHRYRIARGDVVRVLREKWIFLEDFPCIFSFPCYIRLIMKEISSDDISEALCFARVYLHDDPSDYMLAQFIEALEKCSPNDLSPLIGYKTQCFALAPCQDVFARLYELI